MISIVYCIPSFNRLRGGFLSHFEYYLVLKLGIIFREKILILRDDISIFIAFHPSLEVSTVKPDVGGKKERRKERKKEGKKGKKERKKLWKMTTVVQFLAGAGCAVSLAWWRGRRDLKRDDILRRAWRACEQLGMGSFAFQSLKLVFKGTVIQARSLDPCRLRRICL